MDLTSGIFNMLIVLLLVGGICLGLLIALVAGRRQDVTEQRHTIRAEDTSEVSPPQGNQTQLDRIEKLVKSTHISGIRLAGLSIGLAAVIFAGTGLQISLGDRVVVFIGGVALILLSWQQDYRIKRIFKGGTMRRRILTGVGAVFVFLGAIIIFLSYYEELWANASWSPEVVALGLSSVALGLGWWSLSR